MIYLCAIISIMSIYISPSYDEIREKHPELGLQKVKSVALTLKSILFWMSADSLAKFLENRWLFPSWCSQELATWSKLCEHFSKTIEVSNFNVPLKGELRIWYEKYKSCLVILWILLIKKIQTIKSVFKCV